MSSDPINIHEAKTNFSKLIERVTLGEEITIGRAGQPVARLVPFPTTRRDRKPGSAHGAIEMADDFDAPLPERLLNTFE